MPCECGASKVKHGARWVCVTCKQLDGQAKRQYVSGAARLRNRERSIARRSDWKGER